MANETPNTPAAPPAQVTSPQGFGAGAEPHLFDRLSVLYKYRWASMAIFIAVVGWVMVDSYTSVPRYRATARVLIEDPSSDLATPSEISRNVTLADPKSTCRRSCASCAARLAQRTAAKLDMQRVPEFNGQGPKPTQLAVGIALVKCTMWPCRLITSTQAEAPRTALDTVSEASYPEALLARLAVNQVRGSQLVDMTFRAADPEFAARAANMFADEFVANNLSFKVSTLEKSAEWLTGEVEKQGKLVQQSELALAQYKEKQDAGALDSTQNIVVARLTAQNDALTKARLERIQKEGLLRQIKSVGQDVEAISSVIANPNIQTLRSTFNALQQESARLAERRDKHPERLKVAAQLASTEKQLKAGIAKAVRTSERIRQRGPAGERAAVVAEQKPSRQPRHSDARRGLRGAAARSGVEPHGLQPAADAREGTARGGQQPH